MSPPNDAAPPPFRRTGDPGAGPLVVSVPHAGRYYPPGIEPRRAAARSVLEQIEDRHADRLIAPLAADGVVTIVATHARVWIDLNRGEDDADSARARSGLGLIPTRVAGQPLWRGPPAAEEVAHRLATLHRPYHAAIAAALAEAVERYGHALLIDCHSMPSLTRGAQVVVGDLHGASAGPGVAAAAMRAGVRHGLGVARNAPYAGAYTLSRHGRPGSNVHALQIEVDRSLYLGTGWREPSGGLERAARAVADMARAALIEVERSLPLAAE